MSTEKKAGIVYINSYFNRIFVSIFDENDELICIISSNDLDFDVTKHNIKSAATQVAAIAANSAKKAGLTTISMIYVKGPGQERVNAIQALKDAGLKIISIKDLTPIPHNGCRPSKRIKKS